MTGVIYFVAAPGRIKIGHTAKPEERLQSLQQVDMETLTTLATIKGNRKTERQIHKRVEEHRLRGEWFKDCEAVRAVMQDVIDNPPLVEDTSKIPEFKFDWPEVRKEMGRVCKFCLPPEILGMCLAELKFDQPLGSSWSECTTSPHPADYKSFCQFILEVPPFYIEFDRCRKEDNIKGAATVALDFRARVEKLISARIYSSLLDDVEVSVLGRSLS